MLSFTPPANLNGVQLVAELAVAGVVIASDLMIDGSGRLLVDAPANKRAAAETVVNAHVANPDYGKPSEDIQLSGIRAKAQQVIAGATTFTAAETQRLLAAIVLRATR